MKITLSQIVITAMVSGITYASPLKAQNMLDKTVNIYLENTNLLDVLNYLQKTDNVKFIYSKNSIDLTKKVSVNFKNQPLKDVLDQVLTTNGIQYSVMKDRIVLGKAAEDAQPANVTVTSQTEAFATNANAASTPVTGKVTDDAGLPVIGATITEKGTTNGVSAGVDGSFKLNVSGPSAVLVVQFLGYTPKEITVGAQAVINVVLATDVKALNEVVVVGYGTQKKAAVTGSISSVKAADLQDQQVTRIDDALQGRTSGVNVVQSSGSPGAAPNIRIRGVTSLRNSDPLYVIDGVIVDNGGIDNINPNDVESIDVLKDASSAIYGSRASNGVVIVTTKKGKKGPPKLAYNGYVGWQSPVSKVKLTDGTQYATLRNEAYTNDFDPTAGKPFVLPFANPSQYGTGTNWQDQIFSNNALIQNHNLSLSGANDDATYYTSFGYLDQQGVVMPEISHYKKFNFTVNTTYKVKKWLTIGENFTYTYTRSQGIGNTNSVFGGPLSSALNLDPLTPVLANNVASQPFPGDYTNQYIVRNSQGVPFGISHYVANEISNPFAYQQTQLGNYDYANNLLGNAFVEVSPIAGLKIRSQISAKQAYFGSDYFTPLYYLNPSSSNQSATTQYLANNHNLSWNLDNTITYTRAFGLHNITALVGQSAQQESESGLNSLFSGEPVTTAAQASPNFGLAAANRLANGYDNQPYRLASTFARVTYDYDQKYLLTGIIRHDGSSKFGSNNIYGTFPSAEVGYVLTREGFFPKDTFVDFLKIRGSYGVVGNEMALDKFQYTSIISSGRNAVFGTPEVVSIGYSPSAPANPDLKWEQTKTANIGIDATLFNNLTVTVDVYKKVTDGMLQQLQLPAYAGFASQPWANVGTMENKGIEVDLGYKGSIGKFHYNVNGNLSYNNNKVTSEGDQISFFKQGTVQGANGYEIERNQVGYSAGSFYGFNELGTFKSQAEINAYAKNGTPIQPNAKPGDFKWEDINGDGKIDANDRKFQGNSLPPFTYGVNFNADYKNFDLKIFGQGVWGNKIFQAYRRLDLAAGNYPIEALNAWTPQNAASNYPRLTDLDPNNNFKNPSNFYLQNGAYFRIKTLQIGYNVPKAWLDKADIAKVRIFLSSNNLVTLTGYKGYDPEVGINSNSATGMGGIDMGVYPQARSFMVGLDVTL